MAKNVTARRLGIDEIRLIEAQTRPVTCEKNNTCRPSIGRETLGRNVGGTGCSRISFFRSKTNKTRVSAARAAFLLPSLSRPSLCVSLHQSVSLTRKKIHGGSASTATGSHVNVPPAHRQDARPWRAHGLWTGPNERASPRSRAHTSENLRRGS